MSKKVLPPPSGGSLSEVLRSRHQPVKTDPEPTVREVIAHVPVDTDPSPVRAETEQNSPEPATTTSVVKKANASTAVKMVKRSWYVPASTAALLDQLAEDLYYTERQPKNRCLDALLKAGLDNPDEARKLLRDH